MNYESQHTYWNVLNTVQWNVTTRYIGMTFSLTFLKFLIKMSYLNINKISYSSSSSSSSSSSIGTATLVGFDLLNYRWVFSAGRFLQSAVANGTSNPQLGGPVIRTFQLPPPGVPTSETTRANPSSGRWKYGLEIAENFVESGDLHVTFGFFYMP